MMVMTTWQKPDRFHDDAIVYSSIGSTQYELKLHSVNWGILPFISTNQWHDQYKPVQTEIGITSINWSFNEKY